LDGRCPCSRTPLLSRIPPPPLLLHTPFFQCFVRGVFCPLFSPFSSGRPLSKGSVFVLLLPTLSPITCVFLFFRAPAISSFGLYHVGCVFLSISLLPFFRATRFRPSVVFPPILRSSRLEPRGAPLFKHFSGLHFFFSCFPPFFALLARLGPGCLDHGPAFCSFFVSV